MKRKQKGLIHRNLLLLPAAAAATACATSSCYQLSERSHSSQAAQELAAPAAGDSSMCAAAAAALARHPLHLSPPWRLLAQLLAVCSTSSGHLHNTCNGIHRARQLGGGRRQTAESPMVRRFLGNTCASSHPHSPPVLLACSSSQLVTLVSHWHHYTRTHHGSLHYLCGRPHLSNCPNNGALSVLLASSPHARSPCPLAPLRTGGAHLI